MGLKYLFVVEYKDGTTYQQNENDISVTDEKRSCFFDIIQDDVKTFFLIGVNNIYSVNILDGHFEINNVSFYLHDKAQKMTNRRLIFFRQHTHEFNQDLKEQSHEIMYRFGWQANDEKGNNIQHIIEIE